MDQTLQQLGHLLFTSIPTIIIFVLLHFYLKKVLYGRLREVLAARAARIEGRLEAARQDTAVAEQKVAEFEERLRAARAAQYKNIEAGRLAALGSAREQQDAARHEAGHAMTAARQTIAAEAARARTQLQSTAETLANQVTNSVLGANGPRQAATPGAGA